MNSTSRPVLVAVAWPYANGPQHLGHIAGAYLPADVFARYHRIVGNDVLMVSGSDAHGTPITVRAEQDGVEPGEIVETYHQSFLDQWDRLGISFDLFTSTMTANHAEVTRDVFQKLRDAGHIDKRATDQFFDPEAGRFLPDRYVEGTCPHCGFTDARGDQCDNCGRTLDPTDLVDPRSKMTGATPDLRRTEHLFLKLSDFQDRILEWVSTRQGWRAHVQNWAEGFIGTGLHDNAITRDLDWGVELPENVTQELGPGKRFYVWFDAVIGYLSASKEWAQRSGDPDAWKRWWENDAAESYYFIGKDNIPFHAVYWPIYLMGYGGLNLPTNVPANQYVTFKGAKASKSTGVGTPVMELLDQFQPDALRYGVASIFPEHDDNDLSMDDMIARINNELIAAWGNLVNRVLSMTAKMFGEVPAPGPLDERDDALLAMVDASLVEAAAAIEAVELRRGLRVAMHAAQEANAYISALEPWKTAKTDMERTATTLHTALQAINGIKVLFAPYLPFSTAQLHETLGVTETLRDIGWKRGEVAVGLHVDKPTPMFTKLEIASED